MLCTSSIQRICFLHGVSNSREDLQYSVMFESVTACGAGQRAMKLVRRDEVVSDQPSAPSVT
jgi:hypothetical protein